MWFCVVLYGFVGFVEVLVVWWLRLVYPIVTELCVGVDGDSGRRVPYHRTDLD